MEKHQLERREKIATALLLAALGTVAIKRKKGGKIGIARLYPAGSFFADVRDYVTNRHTQLAYEVKNIDPPEFDFGGVEHTDQQLDIVEETFELNGPDNNTLQTE